MNKKGISLIVLVITIIVMIILAGVVILSLNNTGIVSKANEAKASSTASNANAAYTLAYADSMMAELTLGDKTAAEAAGKAKGDQVVSEAGYKTVTTAGEWHIGFASGVYKAAFTPKA